MTVNKQVSLHGKRAFITKDDQVAARNGFVAGGDDKPSIVFPSPDTVAQFDDFLGDVVADQWNVVEGDTGAGSASAIQAGTNGIFRLYSTAGVATPASGEGQAINSGALNWKANQGPGSASGRLRFAARLKLESVNRSSKRIHVFAGFTDNTSYEFPAYDTGAGVISAAADYCGFLFSPGGDTGWSGVAGKSTAGDSGDQVDHLTNSITANKYDTLEVELARGTSDTGGSATFFVNGVPKGRINSPVASNVALTPVIAAFQQDTGGEYVDIDWMNVSAPRDTGI